MSRFAEYMKLIPKGIPHSKDIVESIVNNLSLKIKTMPEDKKNEIIKRRLICETCPFMSKNATTSKEYLNLVGYHYYTDRIDKHCAFCGCNIDMKTAALNTDCGISTWNADNPDNKIPLKWKKYESN